MCSSVTSVRLWLFVGSGIASILFVLPQQNSLNCPIKFSVCFFCENSDFLTVLGRVKKLSNCFKMNKIIKEFDLNSLYYFFDLRRVLDSNQWIPYDIGSLANCWFQPLTQLSVVL